MNVGLLMYTLLLGGVAFLIANSRALPPSDMGAVLAQPGSGRRAASTAVAIAFAAWLARQPQWAEDATTLAWSAVRRADATSRSHARHNTEKPADAGR